MAKKKPDTLTFGQDRMRGEHKLGDSVKSKQENHVKGVLMTSDSGNDPSYYLKKQQVEAKLGRELTTEEFQRDHYEGPESYKSGTSIFDPVLCELIYRWFCIKGGAILDPFAGGSVRGIVAGRLGFSYIGIELREEQVAANRDQGERLLRPEPTTQYIPQDHSIIELPSGMRVLSHAHVAGGTKRLVLDRLLAGVWSEHEEFVYAGPAYGFAQIALAASCLAAGKLCTLFVAERKELHPATAAAQALGASIQQVPAGYLKNVRAKAAEYCKQSGAFSAPFGLDCPEFIAALAELATEAIAEPPDKIWCVSGSGVLTRALQIAFPDAEHHAVQIGKKPKIGNATLYQAPEDFEQDAKQPPPFDANKNYDAKAWQFCRDQQDASSLFWCVAGDAEALKMEPTGFGEVQWIEGDSSKIDDLLDEDEQFDLVFSCPPYADLERYSDMPEDLSTMEYEEFLTAYREIIRLAVSRLRPNRFACFVVGEVRDKSGAYRGFVPDTIRAFQDAGAAFYNEMILINCVGSLAIRAGKQFGASRKVGKTHQNILVFCKGDGKQAATEMGDSVPFGDVNLVDVGPLAD